MSEFCLSEKIEKHFTGKGEGRIKERYVKEFIRLLKENKTHFCVEGKCKCYNNKIPEGNAVLILIEDLNKLAGEGLIEDE